MTTEDTAALKAMLTEVNAKGAGPDVTALRAAIAKADALVAHYHQGIALAQGLKRTLVVRLLHAQFPNLTVSEQEKLLRGYGL